MDKYHIAIFIALLLLCIIVSLFWISSKKYFGNNVPYKSEISIKDLPFETGDLILTSTKKRKNVRSLFGVITNVFTKSFFNHAAIVYVDKNFNRTYVWDIVHSGPRLMPIEELVQEKFQTVYIRKINKPVDEKKFLALMNSQWNNEFNFDVIASWYNRYIPSVPFLRGFDWSQKSSKICAVAVAEMYHGLGVLDFENWGSPIDVIFGSDFAQLGKYGEEPSRKKNRNFLPICNNYEFGDINKLCI